jgi:NitT/TauT family transport system permease protein
MTGAVASGPASRSAAPRGRGLGSRLVDLLPPLTVFVAVVLVWEVGLVLLGVKQFLLPRPSAILEALVEEWPVLARGVVYTGLEALGGLALGVTLGIVAAFATARWATARETLMPLAVAASSVPIIALAPIMSAWFSSDSPAARVAIVTIMVFFPVLINTVRGLTDVDPSALELMHSYAAAPVQIVRKVRIPNALPFIFTGLKIAATLAVIGAVIGEYFGGPRYSLGIFITSEAYVFRYPNAWAAILLACLLGIGFYLTILVLERLFMPWHSSQRATDM